MKKALLNPINLVELHPLRCLAGAVRAPTWLPELLEPSLPLPASLCFSPSDAALRSPSFLLESSLNSMIRPASFLRTPDLLK